MQEEGPPLRHLTPSEHRLAFANATVTINGQSASIFGTPPYTSIGTWNAADGTLGHTGLGANVRTDYTKIIGSGLSFTDFVYIDINSLALPTSLTAPFHYTLTGQDYSDGEIGFGVNNYYLNNGDYHPETRAFVRVSTVDLVPINVTDVNDHAPVISTAGTQTVAENTRVIAGLISTDVDTVGTNPAIFSITGGADAALFQLVTAADGSQLLQFLTAPDYETNPHSYQVEVSAFDGVNTTTKTIAVNVTDVFENSAPTITSNGDGDTAAASIAENTTAVTTVTATDPDAGQTLSYSIGGGADAGKFTIGASTGALSFGNAPNFELPTDTGGNNIYDVTIQVSDGQGGIDTQAIAVTVTNVAGQTKVGGNGGQTLTGTIEEDTLTGGNGKDVLNGGDGNDTLSGGNGADVLNGGAGDDTMDGGSGNDVFIFSAGFGNDRILGFDANPSGGQDFLDISAFGITSGANFAARVAITDEGADTLVTIDAQTIRLVGIGDSTTVTQADFLL